MSSLLATIEEEVETSATPTLEQEPSVELEQMKRVLMHMYYVVRKLAADSGEHILKPFSLKTELVNDFLFELIKLAKSVDGLEMEVAKAYYQVLIGSRRQAGLHDAGTVNWEDFEIPKTRLGVALTEFLKYGLASDTLFHDGIIFQNLVLNHLNREPAILFLPSKGQIDLRGEAEDRFLDCYTAVCAAWDDLDVVQFLGADENATSLSRKLAIGDKTATRNFLMGLFQMEKDDEEQATLKIDKLSRSVEDLSDWAKRARGESSKGQQ